MWRKGVGCFSHPTLINFKHKNIIKYCNRADNWEERFIKRWRAKVPDTGIVFHLGDFSFRSCPDVLDQLTGKIILIQGNHDKIEKSVRNKFHMIIDYAEISFKDGDINDFFCCSHYPMMRWNKSHYGSYMLHGHEHGNINHLNKDMNRLDVSYDSRRMLAENNPNFINDFGDPESIWSYKEIINWFIKNPGHITKHHEIDL